ncbi:MAG: microcystin LR degradation protein MlrC-like protein [Gammaproteobacteria bacterium]|nr:microcystin LR degradation protein MlrC-like protein [Gammaproteobacteria bacterium]
MSTKKRVFVGSVATETNTFSPLRTDLSHFKESFYAAPGMHPEAPTLCSAVFPVARQHATNFNWELIEGSAAWAEPGGVVNQYTWEFLRDQLIGEINAALPLDIVLLGLHGAMVAQNCWDCEGELIEAVRSLVGEKTIIGVTFDPHSHLSERRVRHADIITVFKEFPHTDFVEAAENLVSLAHRTSIGEILPRTAIFDCRMIDILPTNFEPVRSFVDKIKRYEGVGDILSISVIHGFMAGDVPDLGAKIIVISDNAEEQGQTLARQLGMELFSYRGKTRPVFLAPDTALDQAGAIGQGPVVIADVWDNPGGGVPGDSTIILRKMIQRELTNAALATIWDPIAVRTCISAGIGGRLKLRFGGKTSDVGGDPVDATVTVCNIVTNATQRFGDSVVPLGDCVWILVGGIDVILNTVRSQVFSPDIFSNLGVDPLRKSLLVVKSTNHFYDAFSAIAHKIIYAEVDGPYPNNPKTNPYMNLERKIWPRVENPHE